jgi:polyhydroxybutyrate depolymerase
MRFLASSLVLATITLAAAGCSDDTTATTTGGTTTTTTTTTSTATTTSTGGSGGIGGQGGDGGLGGSGGSGGSSDERPYEVFVPSGYDAATPTPLVLLLHGYTASGAAQEFYWQIQPHAEARGFLYVHPDGTEDPGGNQFWNATDACCNFSGSDVDDSAYLRSIIDEVKAQYNVDPKRVFVMGHSNGGFMSYRMACDHADAIAAIASLAGATFSDITQCQPSEPVSVLQIHGTNDTTIGYDGGMNGTVSYPGAVATTEIWATYNGCDLTTNGAPNLDLDSGLAGDETTVSIYDDGCAPGGHAELWTIAGGSHIPALSDSYAPSLLDFLFAHPKP